MILTPEDTYTELLKEQDGSNIDYVTITHELADRTSAMADMIGEGAGSDGVRSLRHNTLPHTMWQIMGNMDMLKATTDLWERYNCKEMKGQENALAVLETANKRLDRTKWEDDSSKDSMDETLKAVKKRIDEAIGFLTEK